MTHIYWIKISAKVSFLFDSKKKSGYPTKCTQVTLSV